jgi:DNA-binding transcriptional MocR family regulator
VDGGGERTLRLSFSSVAARRIDEGVRRLADTIKGALKRPRASGASERGTVPVV